MRTYEKYTRYLHRLMAIVGGFLGGYMLLTRMETFGNAQTVNLISLVLALLGANWIEFLIRIGIFLVYVLGTALFVLVTDSGKHKGKYLSLVITGLCFIILSFMNMYDKSLIIWSMYPCAFCMSYQWNAFPGWNGHVSSTIFSTNNTKQSAFSMTKYILHRNKADLHRAIFFMGTLLFFHIGVVLSFAAVLLLKQRGILLGLLLLILPAIFIKKEETQA